MILTLEGTHIDGSVGRDAEEGGPLVDGLQPVRAVGGPPRVLQFAERALEGGAVLRYQLVAGVQVVQLARQSLQHAGRQRTAVLR